MVIVITDQELSQLLQYTRDICTLLDNKDLMVPSNTVEMYLEMRIASRAWREWAYTKTGGSPEFFGPSLLRRPGPKR
jgi:hypothetical protein